MSLPAFLGLCFSYFLPESILKPETVGMFNIYLEFLIRSSRLKSIEYLRNSRPIGIILFSMLNCTIMCSMLKVKLPNFWLSKFTWKNKNDPTTDVCQQIHPNSKCHTYFLKVKFTRKF